MSTPLLAANLPIAALPAGSDSPNLISPISVPSYLAEIATT